MYKNTQRTKYKYNLVYIFKKNVYLKKKCVFGKFKLMLGKCLSANPDKKQIKKKLIN